MSLETVQISVSPWSLPTDAVPNPELKEIFDQDVNVLSTLRQFTRSKIDVWRRLPHRVWEIQLLKGNVPHAHFVVHKGIWPIKDESDISYSRGVGIDCQTGEIIQPWVGHADRKIITKPATDDFLRRLIPQLNQFDPDLIMEWLRRLEIKNGPTRKFSWCAEPPDPYVRK